MLLWCVPFIDLHQRRLTQERRWLKQLCTVFSVSAQTIRHGNPTYQVRAQGYYAESRVDFSRNLTGEASGTQLQANLSIAEHGCACW